MKTYYNFANERQATTFLMDDLIKRIDKYGKILKIEKTGPYNYTIHHESIQ